MGHSVHTLAIDCGRESPGGGDRNIIFDGDILGTDGLLECWMDGWEVYGLTDEEKKL